MTTSVMNIKIIFFIYLNCPESFRMKKKGWTKRWKCK